MSIGAKKTSALLVDSAALRILGTHLRARLDLDTLDAYLTGDELDCPLLHREMFFAYPSSSTIREKLHNWAFARGWKTTETRLPVSQGDSRLLSSASEISATMARCVMQGNVRHIFLMANDLTLTPMMRVIREYGITISLLYVNKFEFHPYNSIQSNVDEILDPEYISGFVTAWPNQQYA